MAVIIFKVYACNFGAFKSISPPSSRYLNRIKCFGVEGLRLLLRIREVPGSNVDPETGYLD
jgi:hypothetical protein